jgi:threonine/homoserine efflux transporter RhtA
MPSIELLEFIPIILAIVAIIFTGMKLSTLRRKSDIVVSILSILGSMLLIVAQTSWWEAAVIQGKLNDTWFANQIWLIFNIVMMLVIVVSNYPRRGAK